MNENMNINPFASVGSMVEGDAFVGRESEIKDISERLFGKEFGNVSIVGIPKVGKSSLMNKVLLSNAKELWEKKRFLVVWYTLKRPTGDNVTSEKRAVFRYLINEIRHFLKTHNEMELLDSLEEYYEIIRDDNIVWSEFEQNIKFFLEEIVYSNIRIIYCVDEFDFSKELLGESEYELLREISYRPSFQMLHRISVEGLLILP